MNLKQIIGAAKKRAEQTIKDAKDPEKQEERNLRRAEMAVSIAEQSAVAYQVAAGMADQAKEKVAKAVKDAGPLAEQFDEKAGEALKAGRQQINNIAQRLRNRNQGPKS